MRWYLSVWIPSRVQTASSADHAFTWATDLDPRLGCLAAGFLLNRGQADERGHARFLPRLAARIGYDLCAADARSSAARIVRPARLHLRRPFGARADLLDTHRRPLALYNPDPGMAFATALVQGLLALTSFREVLSYSYPDPIPAPPLGSDLSWLANCLPPQAWDELQDLARQAERTTLTGKSASGADDPEAVLVGVESGGLWPRARRNTEPFDPASSTCDQLMMARTHADCPPFPRSPS
jgi:hypothetical protein